MLSRDDQMTEQKRHRKNTTPDQELEKGADPVEAARSKISRSMLRERPGQVRDILDSLDPPDKARLIMRFTGPDRTRLIMTSDAPKEIVREMPPPELWITLKQTGEMEDDSIALMGMAGPEQIQHIADLEWWHKDALDPLAGIYWLMLFCEAGPRTLMDWFRQADEELLVALFARFFTVYRAEPDQDGAEPWRALKNLWTLDDAYFLHFRDPRSAPTIERVLSIIREHEPEKYYGLLDLVDTQMPNEMEEAAQRFRGSRLQDYGFVEFEEAFRVYEPLSGTEVEKLMSEVPAAREARAGRHMPVSEYPLVLGETPRLMKKAIELIQDPEGIEDLALAVAGLVNKILVADGMDLSSLESLNNALVRALFFVEAGLERFSGGDPEKAALVLRSLGVVYPFRAGYSRVVWAGRRAHRLNSRGWLKSTGPGLELMGEDEQVIRGLLFARPRFFGGTDDKGAPVFREFMDEAEVKRAEAAVSRAEFMEFLFFRVFKAADKELELLKEQFQSVPLTWEAVFLTAAAQEFAGAGFRFSPLTPDQAGSALIAMTGKEMPRKVLPETRKRVQEMMHGLIKRFAGEEETLLSQADRFIEGAFHMLEQEIKQLDPANLEPAYIKSMVITAG